MATGADRSQFQLHVLPRHCSRVAPACRGSPLARAESAGRLHRLCNCKSPGHFRSLWRSLGLDAPRRRPSWRWPALIAGGRQQAVSGTLHRLTVRRAPAFGRARLQFAQWAPLARRPPVALWAHCKMAGWQAGQPASLAPAQLEPIGLAAVVRCGRVRWLAAGANRLPGCKLASRALSRKWP